MQTRTKDTNWLGDSLEDQAEKILRKSMDGNELRAAGILSKRRMHAVHNREYSLEYIKERMNRRE